MNDIMCDCYPTKIHHSCTLRLSTIQHPCWNSRCQITTRFLKEIRSAAGNAGKWNDLNILVHLHFIILSMNNRSRSFETCAELFNFAKTFFTCRFLNAPRPHEVKSTQWNGRLLNDPELTDGNFGTVSLSYHNSEKVYVLATVSTRGPTATGSESNRLGVLALGSHWAY